VNIEGPIKEERPGSEIGNIHSSNYLRNSFILEEDEYDAEKFDYNLNNYDNDESNNKTNNSSNFLKNSINLPFAELVFIDLADNQISDEDDLIALASWPMLNEIIIYGNPIVFNNVGIPPLLKQYLIDRLGISIHRIRPLKPLKTPIIIPQREHRIVDDNVPKVSKVPIELRMLTYNQDWDQIENDNTNNCQSNISSARSIKEQFHRRASINNNESPDTVGHLNQNQFFKMNNSKLNENENAPQTFFMTQVNFVVVVY
jgi:hypothetical protein